MIGTYIHMHINKIKLEDIAHCFGNTFETIRDKYNRIDDKGVNHGRAIYYASEPPFPG